MKFCCLLCIFLLLFTNSTFAEQSTPYVIRKGVTGKPFAMRSDGYEEYIENYKASQITQTPITLSSGENITISTKGVFRRYDAVVLQPEYIKIKEEKAGTFKKGDCIYFEIDKGIFLNDVFTETTQGDCKATASGNGSYIKLEITQTSTIPSEITLNRIMILSEGENNSGIEMKDFSLSGKYVQANASTENILLNARFATMEWANIICIEYSEPRFEGRLSFSDNSEYCILNDNIIPISGNIYSKQEYIMVPLRSLYHAIKMNTYYCYNYNYNLYTPDEYTNILWDAEQYAVKILYDNNTAKIFQCNSNIAAIEYDTHTKTTELPVSPEIKNNVFYVPLCVQTLNILFGRDIRQHLFWDNENKTMYIEI